MKRSKMYLVMSDIHGNLSALQAVLSAVPKETIAGIILLGDLIDYGMRSDEVVETIFSYNLPVMATIWGNHEKIIMDNCFDDLSSVRGKTCARYTRRHLQRKTRDYLQNMEKSGKEEFVLGIYRCLAVHGSLEDHFWVSVKPEKQPLAYKQFDFVFSGHSHEPHCFTQFYTIDNPDSRNRKPTVFINPGSVGQPRNGNPRAQFAIVDFETKSTQLMAVDYDISYEQSLYPQEIDQFYKIRLERGI